jgi:anti-sigma regulatory factor (Ser/Thr protein kinase)
LKIYSYLKSGIPMVATNLYTHTQSLNENIAVLVEARADALARGIERAVSDEGTQIARNAAEFCRETYSTEKYVELVDSALKKAR